MMMVIIFITTGFQTVSGQTGFSQKGRKSPAFRQMLFETRTCGHISHILFILSHKSSHSGNRGTSVMTPFVVLTPS